MSYKTEFASNNNDLQAILDTVNRLPDKSEPTDSTFTPTDSGGTTYKSKFTDNNIDLQRILELINNLQPSIPPFDDILVDFEYTDNGDGTATITGWKGTKDGAVSTEIVIPDNNNIKL